MFTGTTLRSLLNTDPIRPLRNFIRFYKDMLHPLREENWYLKTLSRHYELQFTENSKNSNEKSES